MSTSSSLTSQKVEGAAKAERGRPWWDVTNVRKKRRKTENRKVAPSGSFVSKEVEVKTN